MENSSKTLHPFFQTNKKPNIPLYPVNTDQTTTQNDVVSNLSVYKQLVRVATPAVEVPSQKQSEPILARKTRSRAAKASNVSTPISETMLDTTHELIAALTPEPTTKSKSKPKPKPKSEFTNPKQDKGKQNNCSTIATRGNSSNNGCLSNIYNSILGTGKSEGSTPRYVPVQKPKFYSDTIEFKQQQQKEAQFDFYGLINKTLKHDHEFSRLDRNIYGNCHISYRTNLPNNTTCLDVHRKDQPQLLCDIIELEQASFFQSRKAARRQKLYHEHAHARTSLMQRPKDLGELESVLDHYFPTWHTYSSCVLLSQLIYSNNKTVSKQQWKDKYRPKTVNGLLGDRSNLIYLKNWLHQMKIEPMSAPVRPNENGEKSERKKSRKKKQKTLSFIAYDDEDGMDNVSLLRGLSLMDDDDDDDFAVDPKQAAADRRKKLKKESIKSNIILLAGDHGIGKTASVYTVAEELGYEVFEINSGTKRSGKDIMSMVGEMSKNHLVTFGATAATKALPSLFTQSEPKKEKATGKKRKLNPILSSPGLSSTSPTPQQESGLLKHFVRKKVDSAKKQTPPSPNGAATGATKQSLILLEEVDLLFEEDKGFWATIIELSQSSKRPIVMTCNDIDQIPFESLSLQVALDIKPAPETELLPYLWLVCFAEGFVTDPADLICLMAFIGRDIRMLLQTLELYLTQKNEVQVFEQYLGYNRLDLLDMKLKCTPSRLAIDTFRLARSYEEIQKPTRANTVIDHQIQELEDSLEAIANAFEYNAFADTWLGWKENGNQVHGAIEDQVNGLTSLWFEDNIDSESRQILDELENTATLLNSQKLVSEEWSKLVIEEASHWNEVCDMRTNNFEEYMYAIEKLFPSNRTCQPNAQEIMMEYVPYVQSMIYQENEGIKGKKSRQTRSKRKRLYLPLNQDSVNILSLDRPLVDETEFWIKRLERLKKD